MATTTEGGEVLAIHTVSDLRRWVDAALGKQGNPTYARAVTAYLQECDHPTWGSDWSDYLSRLDVWYIVSVVFTID